MRIQKLRALIIFLCALSLAPKILRAHGIVGDRFFPPTISTDDPFATDELAFPTLSTTEIPGDDENPKTRQLDAGFEFDKEILPHFSIGISDDFLSLNPDEGKTVTGWDNISLNAKYELWRNEKHEAIISIGLDADIGGTGNESVGADRFSTFTPTLYLGKGLGDLPDSLSPFKPLAITSTIGQSIPTSTEAPDALELGFAIEYSLPYLQQHVKNIGLPAPLKDMIPLVEFAIENPENRGENGQTTGTINPGILWETPLVQLGAEAAIPMNTRTGSRVGAVVQMQIFIDDLFPTLFGHPIFGADK